MKKKEFPNIPILFFNSGAEDKKAYFAILKSGIKCELRAAYSGSVPLLLMEYQKFYGISEIEEFISDYHKLVKKDFEYSILW